MTTITMTAQDELKEKWIMELRERLSDKVDEYFPKIKPMGKNEGRGEAMVIVGIALAGLVDIIDQAYTQGQSDCTKANHRL